MGSRIRLFNGLSIAFQRWAPTLSGGPRVLCLHGWLDNSNSFAYLGPRLATNGYDVVAIDHIGNGFSDHQSPDCTSSSFDRITNVRGVLDGLGWDNAIIIGHSMGAGIGLIFSGVYPEMVSKLVMIDGLGPPTKTPESAPKSVRRAIDKQAAYYIKQKGFDRPKLYDTIQAAVDARVRNVLSYPGNQSLSYEAASHLITRYVQLTYTNIFLIF